MRIKPGPNSLQKILADRVMETNGVVTQAALTEIFRQQIPALRAAVHDLSQGKSAEGFDKLDKFGAIQEIEDNAQPAVSNRQDALGCRRVKADLLPQHRLPRPGHRSATSLVVAPTHAECRAIAEAVHAELKKTGLLAETERVVTRLQNTGLTES